MPKSKEFLTSSDSESGDSDEPKQKKKKTEVKPEKKKEVKKAESDKGEKDGPTKGPGGEYMFSLAKMRYATVSEFRGKVMVGIREYYDKDGELRPGKKGISLSAEQWQALKDNIAQIDECMSKF